jgi:hypothetical protein
VKIARRNMVLAGVLVLLSAVHWAARSGQEQREILRLFPELHPPLAVRVGIESGDGARRLELALEDGTWVLPQAFDHPARASAVQLLLDRVSALTDVDLVADRAADHASYGLTEGALVLRILGEGGVTLASLAQGKEAPAGPGDLSRATWVRPLGRDEVFRAARLAPLDLDPLAWLDNRWLQLDPSAVRILRVRGSELGVEQGVELERAKERGWSGPARALLEYVRGMYFEAILAREGERPPAVLEIELVTGEDDTGVVLSLGAASEDGSRPAWRSDDPWLVRFAGTMTQPLIERARVLAGKKQ